MHTRTHITHTEHDNLQMSPASLRGVCVSPGTGKCESLAFASYGRSISWRISALLLEQWKKCHVYCRTNNDCGRGIIIIIFDLSSVVITR